MDSSSRVPICKCKDLSSNSSPTKKKKKNFEKEREFLICVPGAAVGLWSFAACGVGRFPLALQAPLLVLPWRVSLGLSPECMGE
jgi:hypothetical protein